MEFFVSEVKSFIVLNNSRSSKPTSVGDIIYKCVQCDFGVASQDSRMMGAQFISVTYDKDGDYPFFTIAYDDIQEASSSRLL